MRRVVRRVLLWMLNPRPRWWESMWVVGIVAALVVASINSSITDWQSEDAWNTSWVVAQRADGSITDYDAAEPELKGVWSVHFRYEVGIGAGRKLMRIGSAIGGPLTFVPFDSTPGPPDAATERSIVRWVATEGAGLSANGPEFAEDAHFQWARAMLASGATREERRTWRYYGLVGAEGAALLVLILCPVIAYLRAVQHAWSRRQLARLKLGRCPQCNYELSGLTQARCPECGAVPHEVASQARQIVTERKRS